MELLSVFIEGFIEGVPIGLGLGVVYLIMKKVGWL